MNSEIWYIYIVRCKDGTLYTGITKNVQRRIDEHNSSKRGAKYTRARRPVQLIYSEQAATRSAAAKREYQVKNLTKTEKLQLIGNIRQHSP